MSEKQKVLVCGDVNGNFKTLFSKIDTINKKSGPFDFLLCVGNFFGQSNVELEPYKNGMRHISVPTYIIGPNTESDVKHYPDIDGCEICPNLTYLGRRGLYNSTSGLKIAYISGVENFNLAHNSSNVYNFTQKDVSAIRDISLKGQPSFRGVDILLSSPWPQDITNLDPNKPQFKYQGSKLIAWLAAHIKPRYHVSGLEDIHYERPPYRNQAPNGDSIEIASRFIALASVGNTQKKKWLYALNLTPVDRTRLCDLAQGTTDETQSPYSASLLNSQHLNQADESRNTQFFYDMDSKGDNKRSKNREGFQKKPRPEFDQAKCWFCLSSPDVSKHLVISVGTEIYLALAKGGLVEDHLLILPITHHASLSILPEAIATEMKIYKKAIAKYYASTDRVPVFFERNYKTSHCQLQAVPVHKNQEPALRETFEELSQSSNFQLDELPPRSQLEQVAPAGTPYFFVELPNGEMLYHRIRKSFPIQFGREVLASDRILDMSDRVDWKDCQLDKEEETQLAKKIRNQFQPYDPVD